MPYQTHLTDLPQDDKILPFHYIRKHVSRSGIYLGIQNDSQYVPIYACRNWGGVCPLTSIQEARL